MDPVRCLLQQDIRADRLQRPLTDTLSLKGYIYKESSEDREGEGNRRLIPSLPGEFRSGEVVVGAPLAPMASELDRFMKRFEDRYSPEHLSRVMRIIAVAASHHRILWIHPFFHGNGRMARLFSHAFLKELGIGSGLWSVSRGLARNVKEYKAQLADADSWREGDLDGRGSLSLRGLVGICEFFLNTYIDQVTFMDELLQPVTLLDRVRRYCLEATEHRALPRGAFEVLREIILIGEIPRARVAEVAGYKERQSRTIISALTENKLVHSEGPRSPLTLNIPHSVVEKWFPKLYP